jgi:DNA-3-methyladenine glycosylase I
MKDKANPHTSSSGVGVCAWAQNDPLMLKYHNNEWGKPVWNDRTIFEFLTLESAQAGLSWLTILRKREGYRRAFANFDPRKVSQFGKSEVAKLLKNSNIIRNRLKIEATINNAKKFLEVQKEFGIFGQYMWNFVEGQPIDGKRQDAKDIPASTLESEKFSRDLKRRGFKFVGPTIIYAHMQAVGMVNDHVINCPCYKVSKVVK